MKIIGREKEQIILSTLKESKSPEFLAVYGRRRVGKTYLIREFFQDDIMFSLTGAYGEGMNVQLGYFHAAMKHCDSKLRKNVKNWPEAFEQLIDFLNRHKVRAGKKRIVFFDELSWLDTPKSGFLSALGHFWNSWGSSQPDLILIICGSSSSWITRKVFKDKGGLHNRVTRRLLLEPFTLSECEKFFLSKDIDYDRRSIVDSYMIFGGIPYYLSLFERGKSVVQNVDSLCFSSNAPLRDEFHEMYASLFKHSEKHVAIVKALARKRKGLTRDEIIAATGRNSGGGLSSDLEELQQSGFLDSHYDYSGKADRYLYRLKDHFSLFYLSHMQGKKAKGEQYWQSMQETGGYNNWAGHSFEQLCLNHTLQVKAALGVTGVITRISTWRSTKADTNIQIDLIIDRADNVVDLCEIKYSKNSFLVDKAYSEKLLTRKEAFQSETKTRKTMHLVLITCYGLKLNAYSHNIQNTVTLKDLFKEVPI